MSARDLKAGHVRAQLAAQSVIANDAGPRPERALQFLADEKPATPCLVVDLDVVRETIRAFLVGSARRPHLVRLMNQEGLQQSPRLDYIFDTIIGPTFSELLDPLERLAKAGKIRPVPARAIFFLLTHGAAAPYTLRALSEHFDGYDGPLDDVAHADLMTELLLAALRT